MATTTPLKFYYKPDVMEVGCDEVAMGSLFFSVFSAAVYWPNNVTHPLIRDSKQLSKRQRLIAYDFIREEAIGYGISEVVAEEVDRINNRQASVKAMHNAIAATYIEPEHILVDGNYFKFYIDRTGEPVSHTCVVSADRYYYSVAAASILAKVTHDLEIQKLCDRYPYLEKYGIRNNVGYGSKEHCDAIEKYGVTEFHRKTFSKVREWVKK